MLAINTQLSGLIMWNCGKFTWGSGTNDIRVWPCFSEMAPAPAAGTRRLPKKIWSHFVLPHLLLSPTPPPSPSVSLPISIPLGPQICKSDRRPSLFPPHTFMAGRRRAAPQTPRQPSRLRYDLCVSSLATCETPEQSAVQSEETISRLGTDSDPCSRCIIRK